MLDRRRLLLTAAGVAAAGLIGCAPKPATTPSPTPSSTSSPTPLDPGPSEAAAQELRVAALLLGLAAAEDASKIEANRWEALSGVRLRHAAVLGSLDPMRRREDEQAAPAGPTPFPGSRNGLLTQTRAALTELEAGHSRLCLAANGPGEGVRAAFWGALAASAAQASAALEADLGGTWLHAVTDRAITPLTPSEASARLLARLQEAVYGIGSTLGSLAAESALRPRLAALLDGASVWRDQVAETVREASETPSPAAPAYRIGGFPSSEAGVASLAAAFWDAALGAAGQWLASSAGATRQIPPERALRVLVGLATEAIDLGAGRLDWPGWPDLG